MAPPNIKRRLLALSLLVACGGSACGGSDGPQGPPGGRGDDGAAPVAGCRDGVVAETGARYRTCFPQSWNGEVVLYAHGYVAASEALVVPDDAAGGASISSVVTGLGYGFAATSYRANGLVVPEAVEDVADLEAELRRLYRPDPVRVWLVGVSEGGLVAALSAERHADRFAGALAACGPVGDFARQIDYVGDFRVVFDYFFPGVLPGSPVLVPDSVRAHWDDRYVPAVRAALAADLGAARHLLLVTGAPGDDPSTVTATALDVLRYDVFVSVDVIARLGGQPFENTTRLYAGSSDDAALNAGVARVAAEPAARAAIEPFQTSGRLTLPVSLLHTTGDPIVPFVQESLYATKVAAAGAAARLRQAAVQRYGHCSFTAGELLDAFGSLVGAT